MIEVIISILEKGLGSDSKILGFLIGLVDSIGPTTINIIEIGISSFIWCFFLSGIIFSKYKKYKQKNRRSTLGEYLNLKSWELFLSFFIGTTAIYLIFTKGLLVNELGNFIYWFSGDQEGYASGLAFLFGYNAESNIYEYYNIGRWLLLVIVMLFSVYNGIMYYTIGEHYKQDGSQTRHYLLFKTSAITLLVIILVLFSIIPDAIINWFLGIFGSSLSNNTL